MSGAVDRLRAEVANGKRFGNTSIVVGVEDLAAVLAEIPSVEYMPVLVCDEDARCLRFNDPDEFGQHEHVLAGAREVFTTAEAATEHAVAMRSKVYGPGHYIVIRTRKVTEWWGEQ